MRKGGIQKKLYRLAYDRPDIQRRVLQLARSVEEVQRLLENTGRRKGNRNRCR